MLSLAYCSLKNCYSWLISWAPGWGYTLPPLPSSGRTEEDEHRETLTNLLRGRFIAMPPSTIDREIEIMFRRGDSDYFKTLLVQMWSAQLKLYVEIMRCLESDLCTYFGVDPSFKRLCTRLGHYLDDAVYPLLKVELGQYALSGDDEKLLEVRSQSRAAWTVIGLWILHGENGLKRFAKILESHNYTGAIECIRRERCRHLFGVPRIAPYEITEEGFILTQSLPTRQKPVPQVEAQEPPSLHSSLLQGLP